MFIRKLLNDIKIALPVSLLLTLPFLFMELVNRHAYQEQIPYSLFGGMMFFPLAFILILLPILRAIRSGNRARINAVTLLFGIFFMIVLAGLWFTFVIDQMPCFLGVPNCD
jgi:hypothetical protein